jgi:hypothetical protein
MPAGVIQQKSTLELLITKKLLELWHWLGTNGTVEVSNKN